MYAAFADLIIIIGFVAFHSNIGAGVAAFYSEYMRCAMNCRNLTPEERFDLIMEFRNSGLTDHQWLEEHGIAPSTFYYWISQFRKNGYPNINEIPEPLKQSSPHKAQRQEVVKINVIPRRQEVLEQNAPVHPVLSSVEMSPVVEITTGAATVRLTNDASPELLAVVLRSLGGSI